MLLLQKLEQGPNIRRESQGKVCHNVTSQKCHAAFCDADGMFTRLILTNNSPGLMSRDLLWPIEAMVSRVTVCGLCVTINQTISNTRTYTGHTQAQGSNQGTFYPRQLMTLTLNKPSYAPQFINHSHCTLKYLTQHRVFGCDLILSSDSVREVVLLSWKILVSPNIFFSQDGVKDWF